jgi:hypothetical protein
MKYRILTNDLGKYRVDYRQPWFDFYAWTPLAVVDNLERAMEIIVEDRNRSAQELKWDTWQEVVRVPNNGT